MDDSVIDRRAMVAAIVKCGLCDDEGYRGTVVCDHVDRAQTVERGLAKVSAALRKKTT